MSVPPPLEDRFLEPPGWRWGEFTRAGRRIRFGSVMPSSGAPDIHVVCLPGLSEFPEKYFEIARHILADDMAFHIIDWMGQGKSGRYLKNSHKRHSSGFEDDLEDLHYWIVHVIEPALKTEDRLVMLAHSMGGNIGLRYLRKYPSHFIGAAFSAPMIGIRAFRHTLPCLTAALSSVPAFFMPDAYIPGGGNWREAFRLPPGGDIFSTDSARGAIHNAWCLAEPALQVGNVTWSWLHEALRSSALLQKDPHTGDLDIPCVIATAEHEALVDNRAARALAEILPRARFLEIPGARHEIMMEKDEARTMFLNEFSRLIEECRRGQRLKQGG
ncbi:MAG: lysophospholipase [Alphaproteobacteria bacterium]|nr:lysophospholipase [Alphaproteobacteria bacterium]